MLAQSDNKWKFFGCQFNDKTDTESDKNVADCFKRVCSKVGNSFPIKQDSFTDLLHSENYTLDKIL